MPTLNFCEKGSRKVQKSILQSLAKIRDMNRPVRWQPGKRACGCYMPIRTQSWAGERAPRQAIGRRAG